MTLYRYKNDACTRSELLNGQLRSLVQCKRSQKQQNGRGSVLRLAALNYVIEEIREVWDDRNQHRAEVEASLNYYRKCLYNAYTEY